MTHETTAGAKHDYRRMLESAVATRNDDMKPIGLDLRWYRAERRADGEVEVGCGLGDAMGM